MRTLKEFAEREFELLPSDSPMVLFEQDFLSIVEKFQEKYPKSEYHIIAGLRDALFWLLSRKPISVIVDEPHDWTEIELGKFQNLRLPALYKDKEKAWYTEAIIFRDVNNPMSVFTGKIDNIDSTLVVRGFPFTPRKFYVPVFCRPYDFKTDNIQQSVALPNGDIVVYEILDKTMLEDAYTYYEKPTDIVIKQTIN